MASEEDKKIFRDLIYFLLILVCNSKALTSKREKRSQHVKKTKTVFKDLFFISLF